jgi:hypothetical protein
VLAVEPEGVDDVLAALDGEDIPTPDGGEVLPGEGVLVDDDRV